MIAQGMQVLIHPAGGVTPVEHLRVGDRVYNPLTSTQHEIVDILSRSARGASGFVIRIPRHGLSPVAPLTDLIVSRSQHLLTRDPQAAAKVPVLQQRSALELGHLCLIETVLYGLFLDRPGHVSIGNALLAMPGPFGDTCPNTRAGATR